jgi:hypothetical protein
MQQRALQAEGSTRFVFPDPGPRTGEIPLQGRHETKGHE